MIGVDEVGRGSWAGPLLVVAAKAIADLPDGLTDSKLLSKAQREDLFIKLQNCCKFGEGWVTSLEIDAEGLASAMKLGVSRALNALKVEIHEDILLDGKVNYAPAEFVKTICRVDADLNYPVVSAASVHAKVRRDGYMKELAKIHPDYGFEHHVGYGTKAHQSALEKFGVLAGVHRLTYQPVQIISESTLWTPLPLASKPKTL